MMRRRLAGLAVVAMLFGCGKEQPAPSPTPVGKGMLPPSTQKPMPADQKTVPSERALKVELYDAKAKKASATSVHCEVKYRVTAGKFEPIKQYECQVSFKAAKGGGLWVFGPYKGEELKPEGTLQKEFFVPPMFGEPETFEMRMQGSVAVSQFRDVSNVVTGKIE